MDANGDVEEEIPIPKGSYAIDWDNFDENTNPFASSGKMMMGSSPPVGGALPAEESPFKPRKSLGHSPPGTPQPTAAPEPEPQPPVEEDVFSDALDNVQNNNEDKIVNNNTDTVGESEADSQTVKKQVSPKKMPKKQAVQSNRKKFKPPKKPANLNQEDDEIQIFMPQAKSKPETVDAEVPDPTDDGTNVSVSHDSTLSHDSGVSQDMTGATSPETISEVTSESGVSQTEAPPGDVDEQGLGAPPGESLESEVIPDAETLPLDSEKGQGQPQAKPDVFDDFLPPAPVAQPLPGPANQQAELIDEFGAQEDMGFSDAEFKPATQVFNDSAAWDMLEKYGGNDATVKENALSRQSLYVKFDPLVKGPASPGLLKGRPRPQPFEAISQDGSDDLLLMNTPPPASKVRHPAARALEEKQSHESNKRLDVHHEDVDKMLACSPGAEESDSGRPGSSTPPKPSEPLQHSVDIVQVLKYSQSDVNRMRKEWELDFQARFLAKERDWLKKYEEQEREKQDVREVVLKKEEQMERVKKSNDQMKTLVSEYEITMTQLIAEKEHSSGESKDSVATLVKEKDQALEDLRSVETAFSDLHRRYEKTKLVVEGFKQNEETLKQCVSEYQTKLKRQEERYQTLKKHAEEKIESANGEIEKVRKSSEGELARLQMALKKSELQNQCSEQTIEQKTRENKELTAICDELISKVGTH